MTAGRNGRGAELVGRSLPGVIPALLPKLRKVEALRRFIALLPVELQGQAAPHEIKLAAAPERFGAAEHGAPASQVSTLFVYCSAAAVAAYLEQNGSRLIGELNEQLPYPLVEALRCEQVSLPKITQQLNNLALRPD